MSVPRARRRPELVLRVPYEGDLRAWLDASTHGDEWRLVEWLANSPVLFAVSEYVVDLREELVDVLDRGRW
jgi:hypothetical protein